MVKMKAVSKEKSYKQQWKELYHLCDISSYSRATPVKI